MEATGRSVGKVGGWGCYVCRNGLAVVKGRSLLPNTRVSTNGDPSVLLLGGESEDVTTVEPALGLTLTDREVDWIRGAGDGAIAVTWYGPEEQTKSSNQDFALAAKIQSFGGKEYIFAAVADGVTTRTFWAARSARLACLTALRVLADVVSARGAVTDDDLSNLRVTLARSLKDALIRDKTILLGSDAIPEGWSVDVYSRNKGNDAYWYNTTLLAAVLGDDVGFILFAGDGGIHVQKRLDGAVGSPIRPLKTGEGLDISSFVSLSVTEADFRAARFSDITSLDSVDVILATDGVDRTLQIECPDDYETLDLSSSRAALAELKRLGEMPKREIDNYSIARLTWPQSAAPRGCRRKVSILPRQGIEELALTEARRPIPDSRGVAVSPTPVRKDSRLRQYSVMIGWAIAGSVVTLGVLVALNLGGMRDSVARWVRQALVLVAGSYPERSHSPEIAGTKTAGRTLDGIAKGPLAEEKSGQEKVTSDHDAQEKAAQEKAAQEKATQEKATQEKATQEKATQEKAAQEKAAQEKAAQERVQETGAQQQGAGAYRNQLQDGFPTSKPTCISGKRCQIHLYLLNTEKGPCRGTVQDADQGESPGKLEFNADTHTLLYTPVEKPSQQTFYATIIGRERANVLCKVTVLLQRR